MSNKSWRWVHTVMLQMLAVPEKIRQSITEVGTIELKYRNYSPMPSNLKVTSLKSDNKKVAEVTIKKDSKTISIPARDQKTLTRYFEDEREIGNWVGRSRGSTTISCKTEHSNSFSSCILGHMNYVNVDVDY